MTHLHCKLLRLLLSVGLFAILSAPLHASPLDTQPTVSFARTAFDDWMLEGTQDRITDDVWITRDVSRGLFNAKFESVQANDSPVGTLWAAGTTDDIATLEFGTWLSVAGVSGPFGGPPNTVGEDLVLYIPADNAYYDLRFTDWGITPSAGGAFAYTRSLNPVIVPEPASAAMIALAAAALVGWRARKR